MGVNAIVRRSFRWEKISCRVSDYLFSEDVEPIESAEVQIAMGDPRPVLSLCLYFLR